MKKVWEKIKKRPRLAVAVVTASVGLATAFSVPITVEQKTAIELLATAVLVLFGG